MRNQEVGTNVENKHLLEHHGVVGLVLAVRVGHHPARLLVHLQERKQLSRGAVFHHGGRDESGEVRQILHS